MKLFGLLLFAQACQIMYRYMLNLLTHTVIIIEDGLLEVKQREQSARALKIYIGVCLLLCLINEDLLSSTQTQEYIA